MLERKTLSLYSHQLLSDMLIFTGQFTAKITPGALQSKILISSSVGLKLKSSKKRLKDILRKMICKMIEMFTYA